MRLKQRIVRILIEEIIAGVDNAASDIVGFVEDIPAQQNLWGDSGSGSRPKL